MAQVRICTDKRNQMPAPSSSTNQAAKVNAPAPPTSRPCLNPQTEGAKKSCPCSDNPYLLGTQPAATAASAPSRVPCPTYRNGMPAPTPVAGPKGNGPSSMVCKSAKPKEMDEGALVLDVVPCPDMRLYENLPAQTVDVRPLHPVKIIDPNVCQETTYLGCLKHERNCEKRRDLIETAENNILPEDFDVPPFEDSALECAVMQAYVDNLTNWERLTDQSAILLGDHAIPAEHTGLEELQEENNEEPVWVETVKVEEPQPIGNLPPEYRAMCTDDATKLNRK